MYLTLSLSTLKTLGVLDIVLIQLETQVVPHLVLIHLENTSCTSPCPYTHWKHNLYFTLSLSTLKTLGVLYIVLMQLETQVVLHLVLIHLENTSCTLHCPYQAWNTSCTSPCSYPPWKHKGYFTLSISTLKTLGVLYIVLIQGWALRSFPFGMLHSFPSFPF